MKHGYLSRHGIHHYSRPPVYLGVIVVCISVPVHASIWPVLATMSVVIPIFLNRIRADEAMSTEEFGHAYRMYQEATSKLIPFF